MKTEHAAAQEWTVERLIKLITYEPDREDFEEASKAINAALSAERVTKDNLRVACEQPHEQLAIAQAAIVEHNKHIEEMHTASSDDCYEIPLTDTAALDAAIAEAQQPLVDALKQLRVRVTYSSHNLMRDCFNIIDAALAKVGKSYAEFR